MKLVITGISKAMRSAISSGTIADINSAMTRIDRFQRFGLLAFLLLMGIFFSSMSPYFASWENYTNILVQSAVLIIAGTGMTLVIATAGIDLSIDSKPWPSAAV